VEEVWRECGGSVEGVWRGCGDTLVRMVRHGFENYVEVVQSSALEETGVWRFGKAKMGILFSDEELEVATTTGEKHMAAPPCYLSCLLGSRLKAQGSRLKVKAVPRARQSKRN